MQLSRWTLRAAPLAMLLMAAMLSAACLMEGIFGSDKDDTGAAMSTPQPDVLESSGAPAAQPTPSPEPIAWQEIELESAAGSILITHVATRDDGTLAVTVKLKDGGVFDFNFIVGLASESAEGNLYVQMPDGTQVPIIETAENEADPNSWDLIFPVEGETAGLVLIFPDNPPIDVSAP
jgi:hypothetical protein